MKIFLKGVLTPCNPLKKSYMLINLDRNGNCAF